MARAAYARDLNVAARHLTNKRDFPDAIRGFVLVEAPRSADEISQYIDFYGKHPRCVVNLPFHIMVSSFAIRISLRRTRPIRIIRLIGCRASRHLSMSPPPSSKRWIKPEPTTLGLFFVRVFQGDSRAPSRASGPAFGMAPTAVSRKSVRFLTAGQISLYNPRFPAFMPAGEIRESLRRRQRVPLHKQDRIRAQVIFLDRS